MPQCPSARPDAIGALALLCVLAFILNGSLYPFVFAIPHGGVGPVRHLLGTWRDWDHRGDLIANIVLYAPFGFTAVRALPGRLLSVAALAVLAGTALSVSMELAQYYEVSRDSTLGDVYANAIGSAVGALAAAVLRVRGWRLFRLRDLHWPAVLLLTACIASRLYPYVPEIALHKYLNALRPVLAAPVPPPLYLGRLTVAWLAVGVMLEALAGPRMGVALYGVLVLGEWAGKVSIVDHALSAAEVVGAVLAVPLLLAGRAVPRARAAVTAAGFLALIATGSQVPRISPALPRICDDVFVAGGLIWLLGRAGVAVGPATLLAVLAIAVLRPDQSIETCVALLLGVVLFVLGRRERGWATARG